MKYRTTVLVELESENVPSLDWVERRFKGLNGARITNGFLMTPLNEPIWSKVEEGD